MEARLPAQDADSNKPSHLAHANAGRGRGGKHPSKTHESLTTDNEIPFCRTCNGAGHEWRECTSTCSHCALEHFRQPCPLAEHLYQRSREEIETLDEQLRQPWKSQSEEDLQDLPDDFTALEQQLAKLRQEDAVLDEDLQKMHQDNERLSELVKVKHAITDPVTGNNRDRITDLLPNHELWSKSKIAADMKLIATALDERDALRQENAVLRAAIKRGTDAARAAGLELPTASSTI